MVQRKMPSKLGIKDDHVKSEKLLAKASQDGKSRGSDMKKKMKKLRSIKLSDLDAMQSSSTASSPPPSRRCFSHPGKPPSPVHVPTMDGSPNYMKPTSSSHAKKELFPVSLRNSPPMSNYKNLTSKFSSASKASCSFSSKKSAKALTRSSSLILVRSLTKTTSFKPSNRACPRKSATARATCSSTLKDSKFPAYLMLNQGGTESEGTSIMKVCPYTYCSLNGHHHDTLPPLKSFMSARRRLLKTQKSMIRLDMFIEIYAKERETEPTEADQMGEIDFVKKIEESVKQVTSEIDLEEDYKKSFDGVSVEVDTKGIFLREELSLGSYCSDESYDEELMKGIETEYDSNSKGTKMEWDEQQQLCGFGREEDVDSKFESLSESSHDVSVTWLDEILTSYYVDVMAEETFKEFNTKETQFFEEQNGIGSTLLNETSGSTEIEEIGYQLSYDLGCDQSFSTEVSFEYHGNTEDNSKENEKQLDDETSCDAKVIDEEKIDDNQCQNSEEGCSSLKNHDKGSKGSTMAVARGEDQDGSTNWKGEIRCKRPPVEDEEEMRKFNPRDPNFLPLVPEPEPEKIDLRHQMMDQRKDAEEWMLDCALRQVVTKLAPARKKKVALLVEAFETIMPIPKCETHHMRNNSAFPQARHIQACS